MLIVGESLWIKWNYMCFVLVFFFYLKMGINCFVSFVIMWMEFWKLFVIGFFLLGKRDIVLRVFGYCGVLGMSILIFVLRN